MSASRVIEMFTPEGETVQYRLFSQRLPEFMAKYPAETGWRIERDAVTAASLAPELVALHTAAIQAGKSPSELGLPSLPRGMVFRCRLLDANGTVIRTASTLTTIREFDMPNAAQYAFKDWETAETNAFQRLVAAMGFDGSVLDADEGRAEKASQTAAASITNITPMVEVEDDALVEDLADESAQSSAGAAPAKAVTPVGARKPSDDQLFAGFRRQVDMLAKQLGVPAPEVKTTADCKRALKELVPIKD